MGNKTSTNDYTSQYFGSASGSYFTPFSVGYNINSNSTTNTKTKNSNVKIDDPLTPYIIRDLPDHIIERCLFPSSGRMFRTYRIRHVNSGAVLVLKAMLIRVVINERIDEFSKTENESNILISGSNNEILHDSCSFEYGTITPNHLFMHESELYRILNVLNVDLVPGVLPYYFFFAGNFCSVSYPIQYKPPISLISPSHTNSNIINLSRRGKYKYLDSNNPNMHKNISPLSSKTLRKVIVKKPIYLLRPHMHSTLADRFAKRPFLTNSEKTFIMFQILNSLQKIHDLNVCHGNICTENIGLTSWNYAVLMDICGYRPVCISDDDLSDWIYYFQERNWDGKTNKNISNVNFHSFSSDLSTSDEHACGKNQTSRILGVTDNSNILGVGSFRSDGEKKCYLAPERFVSKSKFMSAPALFSSKGVESQHKKLTPEMDIFSMGCVLIELFLSGERALDIGDLIAYRRIRFTKHARSWDALECPSLRHKLNKIECGNIRAVCRHMLNLDPSKRLSAGEYLDKLTGSFDGNKIVRPLMDNLTLHLNRNEGQIEQEEGNRESTTIQLVPKCYREILLPLFIHLRKEIMSPDARIVMAVTWYGRVMRETVGVKDLEGEKYFRSILGTIGSGLEKLIEKDNSYMEGSYDLYDTSKLPIVMDLLHKKRWEKKKSSSTFLEVLDVNLLTETNALIHTVESSHFSIKHDVAEKIINKLEMRLNEDLTTAPSVNEPLTSYAYQIDSLKGNNIKQQEPRRQKSPPSPAALVVFLQFVLSTIRHCYYPSSKVVALQLLIRVAAYSTDDIRLQRIVPTTINMIYDANALVRASAVRTLTEVISTVSTFPPSDAQLFPQYIFDRMSPLLSDASLLVRVTFIECISPLAETALRFLETSHAIRLYETMSCRNVDLFRFNHRCSSSTHSNECLKTVQDHVVSASEVLLFQSNKNVIKLSCEEDDTKARQNSGSEQITRFKNAHISARDSNNDYVNIYPSFTATLIHSEYDDELLALHETVASWVVHISTDMSDQLSTPLKTALLASLGRLCPFFGQEGVMLYILPHILAFLNYRKEWQVRALLCRQLPTICSVVGRASTIKFVVPCIETALVDDEDLVISNALFCLASLVDMKLLTCSILLGDICSKKCIPTSTSTGIIKKFSCLLVYPSNSVRRAFCALVVASCYFVRFPDDEVFIIPLVRPFLQYDIPSSYLGTIDNIMAYLVIPYTKNEWKQEQKRLQLAAIPPINNLQRNYAHVCTFQLLNCSVHNQIEEEYHSAYLESIHDYLKMLSRNKKKCPESVKCNGHFFRRIIVDDIEVFSKASFSYYIPIQKYAELITFPLPSWYHRIKCISSTTSHSFSNLSYLRSMTCLYNFFGVIIVSPTNLTLPRQKWKNDHMYNILFKKSKRKESEKMISSLPLDSESRIFTAALNGEWGARSILDPDLIETTHHVSNISSLGIPSIPPRLGLLEKEYVGSISYSDPGVNIPASFDIDEQVNSIGCFDWKPKVDALVASSLPNGEHEGPVTRLVVSQDHTFFVSAGFDGTCKVWETRQFDDTVGDLRSCLTFQNHRAIKDMTSSNIRINDVSIIENSHSIASASSDGTVYVWRVDMVSKQSETQKNIIDGFKTTKSRASGFTMLRKVDPSEGEILAVSHFNTLNASILAFATQRGIIHSWDLRSEYEPFSFTMHPELGYLTSMAFGNDRNWMTSGTNKGFVGIWDVRFQKLVKLWQHSNTSSISKLDTTFIPLQPNNYTSPCVIMGSGINEISVFDVLLGSCHHCFRVINPEFCYFRQSELPSRYVRIPKLYNISIPSESRRRIIGLDNALDKVTNYRSNNSEPNICSFISRVKPIGQNYLITGGSDGFIRYWDFTAPSLCYSVSGLLSTQPKAIYESVKCINVPISPLIICRQMPVPITADTESPKVPKKMGRGLSRPEHRHVNSILDLKKVDLPIEGLLSCSKDGFIKLWR